MTFGEKIRALRKGKNMSQTQLGNEIGASLRTVRGWEMEGRCPKNRDVYQKLADVLDCDISYLMSEDDAFVFDMKKEFGSRGAAQARAILEQTSALFAGGALSEEDQLQFVMDIQTLFLDSKRKARKYAPKKYREDGNDISAE